MKKFLNDESLQSFVNTKGLSIETLGKNFKLDGYTYEFNDVFLDSLIYISDEAKLVVSLTPLLSNIDVNISFESFKI